MKKNVRLVLVNANCRGGRGINVWSKIYRQLAALAGPFSVLVSKTPKESTEQICTAISNGVRSFVSAGGDGAINMLINAIFKCKGSTPLSDFMIGAVGLGSSNDYHKSDSPKLEDIPVRVNDENPILRDVGEFIYQTTDLKLRKAYFLISTSLGIVAEGNRVFNEGGPFLNLLKKTSTQAAIFWTFFRTLLKFNNIPLTIRLDQCETLKINVSYLAVSKTPYISGMFHFEDPVRRDDGSFMVKILSECSKLMLIKIMIKLMAGRENGIPNLITRHARTVEATAPAFITLEYDGETQPARRVAFHIHQEKIWECG
ncbi:hypothetical protein BVY01_00335 [bacterium I07]|nr:hypothetical protein BVY01_00335 [bacterium I07]